MNELTQDRLKEILHYDEHTGDFTWLVAGKTNGKNRVGKTAGWPDKSYIRIMIDGKKYLAHRLAWLYKYGVWPDKDIDHINCVGADNRMVNLRNVSNAENQQNIKKPKKNSKSGFLGVSKKGNKFIAAIGISSESRHIGCFSTPEEAHQAYLEAKRTHHPFNTL